MQAAAAHRHAFSQWVATVFADVERRWQKLVAKATERGRKPHPSEDLLETMRETADKYEDGRKQQADLDRIATGRARAARKAMVATADVQTGDVAREQPATAPALTAEALAPRRRAEDPEYDLWLRRQGL